MTTQRNTSRQWQALRLWVLDRDRWVCQINGPTCTRHATVVDHVVPVADGGPYVDPSNLRAACVTCNGQRSAVRTNDRRRSDRHRYRTTDPDYASRL